MPLQLGLDTGAEKTLLARSVYERRKGQFREVRPQRLIDFLRQFRLAINFKKKKVYLWTELRVYFYPTPPNSPDPNSENEWLLPGVQSL